MNKLLDIALMAFVGLLVAGLGSCVLMMVALIIKALWRALAS